MRLDVRAQFNSQTWSKISKLSANVYYAYIGDEMNKINVLTYPKVLPLIVILSLVILGEASGSAAGLPTLQQTIQTQAIQLNTANNQISILNNSVASLSIDNQNQDIIIGSLSNNLQSQNTAIGSLSNSLLSQDVNMQELNNRLSDVDITVGALNSGLNTLKGDVERLRTEVDTLSTSAIPPKDFAFFTTKQIKYGSYYMSSAFDANDYSKFSMSFTCTTQTNDEVKYWIETSADGVNWSPWGYYHVNCNGIYGGASINSGEMPARYFAVAVFQISNNTRTNTITSVGRFSN